MIRQLSHARNGRTRRIVLGAVLGLGAIGLLTVWSIRRASAPPENGREIAAAFLADLREGRIDAAWAATSAEFRSFLGRERLIAFVRANPVLRGPVEFADVRELEANGLRLLVYTFRPATAAPIVQVLLAQEQGIWKVERLLVE